MVHSIAAPGVTPLSQMRTSTPTGAVLQGLGPPDVTSCLVDVPKNTLAVLLQLLLGPPHEHTMLVCSALAECMLSQQEWLQAFEVC